MVGLVRVISLFALLVIITLNTAFGQSKILRIGADGTFPPFTHINIYGEFSGFDADLTKSLCKAMKRKCKIERFDMHSLSAALRGGKVDLIISAFPIRDEPRKLIEFSTAYLQIPAAVAVRKDTLITQATALELEGKKLGLLKSSPQNEYANIHLPKSQTKPYDTRKSYQLDLANGKIEATIEDPLLLQEWLKTPDGKNCCRILGYLPYDPQINGEGYGIAIARENVKLLKHVNQALDKLRANGELVKIRSTHLPFLN